MTAFNLTKELKTTPINTRTHTEDRCLSSHFDMQLNRSRRQLITFRWIVFSLFLCSPRSPMIRSRTHLLLWTCVVINSTISHVRDRFTWLLVLLFSRFEHSAVPTAEIPTSSTCPINHYELCQDLHEKQLEMLERKYGGHLRCRRAATIIQRAYRQYKLKENFRHLCATVKTSQRLSCSFIDQNPHQLPTIKPLKPCLRVPKPLSDESSPSSLSSSNTPTNPESNVSHFNDRHLDLPSINFEHFIETSKKPATLSNNRKRVCIVTDAPSVSTNIYDRMDESSDFLDEPSKENPTSSSNGLLIGQLPLTNWQFYQDLTGSPLDCRKPIPPGKILGGDW